MVSLKDLKDVLSYYGIHIDPRGFLEVHRSKMWHVTDYDGVIVHVFGKSVQEDIKEYVTQKYLIRDGGIVWC